MRKARECDSAMEFARGGDGISSEEISEDARVGIEKACEVRVERRARAGESQSHGKSEPSETSDRGGLGGWIVTMERHIIMDFNLIRNFCWNFTVHNHREQKNCGIAVVFECSALMPMTRCPGEDKF